MSDGVALKISCYLWRLKGPSLEILPVHVVNRSGSGAGREGGVVVGLLGTARDPGALHREQLELGALDFTSPRKCVLSTFREPHPSWVPGAYSRTRDAGGEEEGNKQHQHILVRIVIPLLRDERKQKGGTWPVWRVGEGFF